MAILTTLHLTPHLFMDSNVSQFNVLLALASEPPHLHTSFIIYRLALNKLFNFFMPMFFFFLNLQNGDDNDRATILILLHSPPTKITCSPVLELAHANLIESIVE